MAPCRQLLMWSVPSIAVLLGIFWFRKKREYAKSDPGGRERLKSLKEELAEVLNAEAQAMRISPCGKTDRSIIKSAPIDIVPNGSGSQRSSPLQLTDEEVDIEIEKIIRKKSLEKEKRMSFGTGTQSLVANSCKMESSFVIKETPSNLFSSLETENTYNKNDVDACSIKTNEIDAKVVISKDSITDELEAEYSQQNSTKLDTAASEVNTTDDSTVADTEELNMNNNNNVVVFVSFPKLQSELFINKIMKKHKENLFAEKFHLLSSQQSEDITWSSSESSDFETNPPNVDKLCNITNRRSIKRKRKQTVPKNISNLDVTIVDVNKDAKKPSIKVEIEDPIIKSENEISDAKSPILGSTQYFPPYQCKNTDTSPIITTKSFGNQSKVLTSPILVLKAASPKISPNVRKKLFENKNNISKKTTETHKSKSLATNNNNYCLDRRKISNKVTTQEKSEKDQRKEENSELQSIKCELSSQKSVKFDNTDEIEILETQQSSNFENTPRKLNLDESVSMLKTSSTELAKKVKSYFDCHFSSENASQNTISEVSTPKNNSRSSDDIEILTITTQVVSKSSMESMKPEIEVTTNKKEKKIRYKKDGLAYRLNSLVKKQAASISLWHHEKFLAANSNFFIPKGEFLGFRICKIHFKYGCYLLEAMDTNDDNFMIFINKCHMTSETISEDSILKLYEPYKMLSFNNNCKYVINVVKFEFVNIKK